MTTTTCPVTKTVTIHGTPVPTTTLTASVITETVTKTITLAPGAPGYAPAQQTPAGQGKPQGNAAPGSNAPGSNAPGSNAPGANNAENAPGSQPGSHGAEQEVKGAENAPAGQPGNAANAEGSPSSTLTLVETLVPTPVYQTQTQSTGEVPPYPTGENTASVPAGSGTASASVSVSATPSSSVGIEKFEGAASRVSGGLFSILATVVAVVMLL